MVQLTEAIVKGKTRLDRLDEVRTLNMWGQGITDVSILQQCKNVEIISLSVNEISSLKDFMCCTALKELYLRKNNVASLSDIRFLMRLPRLKVLWLSDNPCAELHDYRAFVVAHLPQLEKLDNVEVTEADRQAAQGLARLQPANSAELLLDTPAADTPTTAVSAQALEQIPGCSTVPQAPRTQQVAAATGAQQQHSDYGNARAIAAMLPAASNDSYNATIGMIVPDWLAGIVVAGDAGSGDGAAVSSGAAPDLFPQQEQYNPQRYSSQPGNQVPHPPKVLPSYDHHQQPPRQVQQQQQQQQQPQPQAPRPSTPNSSKPMGSSNVLYAVMALLGELDVAQLGIVHKEVEQRLVGITS